MNEEEEMKMDILAGKTSQELTKMTYEKYGIKYTVYEGENRFYGTPIPQGYKVKYCCPDFGPDSLKLIKKKAKGA